MAIKNNRPLGDDKKHPDLGVQDNSQREDMSSADLFPSGNSQGADEVLTVGDQLRLQREANGHSLEEIADLTRLRTRQIKALEAGDYGSLPGQVFVVGFLKSYANALGLDATEIVALYRKEEAGQLEAPQLAFPEPTSEGRKPGTYILIATSIAAVLTIGGWYFYLNENKINLELVPDLPSQLAEKITRNTADLLSPSDVIVAVGASESEKAVSDPQGTLTKDNGSANFNDGSNAPKEAVSIAETQKEVSKENLTESSRSVETNAAASDVASSVIPGVEKSLLEVTPATTQVLKEVPVPRVVPAQSLNVTNGEEETAEPRDPNDPIVSDEKIGTSKNNKDAVLARLLNERQEVFPQEKLDPAEISVELDEAERIPETLGVQNTNARIVLLAQQDVWVQIIAAGNEVVLERVLGAGDTFMLPDLVDLRLNTANAAGIEIRLDGKILGSVGTYGGIVRDMDLSPSALKQRFPEAQ